MAKTLKTSIGVPFSFMVNLEVIKHADAFLYLVRDFRSGMPLQVTDDVKDIAPCVLRLAEDFQAINTMSAKNGSK